MVRTSVIHCGDNLEVLVGIPEESVDLIYADPPFFSNRNYEIVWGDHAEIEVFKDRWKGGINNYLQKMEERLKECYRVLKDTGSMYLHCDWHASHYLKQILDKIFGDDPANPKFFRNEIIWCYTGSQNAKKNFQRKHDNIFFYTKRENGYTFNGDDVLIPFSSTARYYKDIDGKLFTKKYGKKYYVKHDGKIPEDYWGDIPRLHHISKERRGYPTQKPEALLERIIKASSDEGDIVLDPFCGCGTAIAVAHKLNRRWIGIDVAPTGCNEMAERMREIGAKEIEMRGMNYSIEELKSMNPINFQIWACNELGGHASKRKTGDMGIDGIASDGTPVQVKQSEHVGRNAIDNFETACRRGKKDNGYFVAFSYTKGPTGAHEETSRAKREDNIEIILLTADDILKKKHKQYLEEKSK